jgi:PadR family transcriptional regulator, regulatory protein PadR
MARSNLGELEEQVLLILMRLGGESYALQVAEALAEVTGREVSAATTFMVMRRLEQRGLLSSRVGDADPAWSGRPRRFYKVHRSAVRPLLRASRDARLLLWQGLEHLWR